MPPPSKRKPPAERIVRRKLADGTTREYRYPAWQPAAPKPKGDTIRGLLRAYEASPEWASLSKSTQSQYLIYLREWLKVPDADPKAVTRREIMAARDAIARTRGPGAATAFGRVTATLFTWALDRDWVPFNPAQRLKAIPGGELPAWTEHEIAFALERLPKYLRRVVVLAIHTGQRRGDLCAMTWAAFDGNSIRVQQQKTGAALVIPAHPTLKAELAEWRREAKSVLILESPRANGWSLPHLSCAMSAALVAIGLRKGLNVHGLRKSAARRLAEAGCSVHEIAAITGHKSLSMVQHYTSSVDQERLAGAAIARLQFPTKAQKS